MTEPDLPTRLAAWRLLETSHGGEECCLLSFAAAAVREALEEAEKLCPRHCTCPPGTEMDHKPYCAYGIAAAIAALYK